MDFVPILALGLVVKTTVDILRFVRGRDWNGAGTLLTAWVGGFAAAALFAQTEFADGISVGDQTLGDLNVASLLVVGLTLGSVGANVNEFFASRDANRSTAKPQLFADNDGQLP